MARVQRLAVRQAYLLRYLVIKLESVRRLGASIGEGRS